MLVPEFESCDLGFKLPVTVPREKARRRIVMASYLSGVPGDPCSVYLASINVFSINEFLFKLRSTHIYKYTYTQSAQYNTDWQPVQLDDCWDRLLHPHQGCDQDQA